MKKKHILCETFIVNHGHKRGINHHTVKLSRVQTSVFDVEPGRVNLDAHSRAEEALQVSSSSLFGRGQSSGSVRSSSGRLRLGLGLRLRLGSTVFVVTLLWRSV